MQDQPQKLSEQEREPIFQLNDDFLTELGWNLRAEQHSYLRKVYEKKGANLWMVIFREPDCPPFIYFVPIDPSLAGPSEHATKGNMYVQNVMDLKILLWMVEYIPEPYQSKMARFQHNTKVMNLLLEPQKEVWPTPEQK